VEILSPAGNLEKLKYAVAYGADAVYAGSQNFSLRSKADNFSHTDILEAVSFCHERKVKLFIPLNIYAHNKHIDDIKIYIKELSDAGVDAIIVSDLGVFELVKKIAPDINIHVSTQANVTSYQSVRAYEQLGAKRIILARELTFFEIQEIRQKCPEIELEMFVHGAMCISYSGRCLLSAFLNGRSANRGECTHPCRWNYYLIEESRPNEHFSIEEDLHGFYFLNSKDLCLFNRLYEIYKCGINSVKIEGRMKSLYYIAAVTRAYKQALLNIQKYDTNNTLLQKDPDKSIDIFDNGFFRSELDKVSHRVYIEGFFDSYQGKDTQDYGTAKYIRDWQFVGNILKRENDMILVRSYFKINKSDEIELIFPEKQHDMKIKIHNLFNEDMMEIEFTKPNSCFYLKISENVPEYGIIRKRINYE